jgi:hypothetical protein
MAFELALSQMNFLMVLKVTSAHKSFITTLKVADKWLGSSLNLKLFSGKWTYMVTLVIKKNLNFLERLSAF